MRNTITTVCCNTAKQAGVAQDRILAMCEELGFKAEIYHVRRKPIFTKQGQPGKKHKICFRFKLKGSFRVSDAERLTNPLLEAGIAESVCLERW